MLAAPLAVLRQSIQELHADLFIDTADDRMIPYLAEMVGTALVFPDAESNRRDVRGTVGWRRRKGTPAALEEMGGELTAQSVVLQEGWKRIQLAQDLDLLRPERVVVDLRPAVVAEQATGPLDALFHAVDVRRSRRRPAAVTRATSPTGCTRRSRSRCAEATAVDRTLARLGRSLRHRSARRAPAAARAADRRATASRSSTASRNEHFAAAPERWFGQPGGFTVRVCGAAGRDRGDGGRRAGRVRARRRPRARPRRRRR